MPAGYSGTPLVRKLGIRSGMRVVVDGAPVPYPRIVEDLPDEVELLEPGADAADVVHLFTDRAAGLEKRLRRYREVVRPDGMIWVSWPKRASRVQTDVTEEVVRAAALAVGLVDVKVCAVDEVWSGLKLVIPLASR